MLLQKNVLFQSYFVWGKEKITQFPKRYIKKKVKLSYFLPICSLLRVGIKQTSGGLNLQDAEQHTKTSHP